MLVAVIGSIVGLIISVVVIWAVLDGFKVVVHTRAERRLVGDVSPYALLASRYARGDIGETEFQRAVAALREADPLPDTRLP